MQDHADKMDKFHSFGRSVSNIPLPEQFTYPFHYTPHPLSVIAAEEVQAYLLSRKDWENDLEQGKMFGVLTVQTETGELGFLAAFSGILAGKNLHSYFVPPIYDLQQPQGFFRLEEDRISAINARIKQLQADKEYTDNKNNLTETIRQAEQSVNEAKEQLKAAQKDRESKRQTNPSEVELANMIRESQFQKAELKRLKQQWNDRIEALQSKVKAFESVIEKLKTERKNRSATLQQQLFE